jgi:hypothetical protein
MNRQSLLDYGLGLGIEYATLQSIIDGPIVKFMHDRQTDVTFIEAYDRGICFSDRGDHWIAWDAIFQSRSLNDAEARQLLVNWLDPNANYWEYCDPAHLPDRNPDYQGEIQAKH